MIEPPEPHRVETSAGEVSSLEVGEGASLLWLDEAHGSQKTRSNFLPLLASSFRVIAPDLPAAGAADATALAREVLDRLSVASVAIVGLGPGGGEIAQALALDDDRVGALVLIGSPALEGRQSEFASRELPILLLWGEDDDVVPITVAERLSDSMPTSVLAVLPGCGHDPLGDAPQTVGPLLFDWLRSRYLGIRHEHAPEPDAPILVSLGRRPPPEREFCGESFDDDGEAG